MTTPRRSRPGPRPAVVLPGNDSRHREGWSEYIPIGELKVDTSYQRDIDYAFVSAMAADFDYTQLDLQAWSIGRRLTGRGEEHTDFIIDGQHRWLALSAREDDSFVVSCHVRISPGADWEANEYLRINFARKQPTSAGRFKAAVVAGRKFGWDNDAAVAALLKELGIETPATTRTTFTRGIGGGMPVLLAIGKVCRLHSLHADLTRLVLLTQRDAWGESSPKAYDGILFDALADFWAAHETECVFEDVVKVLHATTPDVLRDAGEQMRGTRTMPLRVCIARTIAEMFNKGRRYESRVRELAPVNYVSIRQSRTSAAVAARTDPEARSEQARKGHETLGAEGRSERARKGHETRRVISTDLAHPRLPVPAPAAGPVTPEVLCRLPGAQAWAVGHWKMGQSLEVPGRPNGCPRIIAACCTTASSEVLCEQALLALGRSHAAMMRKRSQ